MTKEGERVGVIIPMYNAERTIDATLDSVCRQSHHDLDIVVVDDGSTDRSASLVLNRAARDTRIRLIQQSNGGVAMARNSGAAATDALYLAFVDADDVWAPDKVRAQLQSLREVASEAAVVYCWYVQIDEDGRAQAPNDQHRGEGMVLDDLFRNYFVGNGSSFFMSRSVFDKVGGFDTSLRFRQAQGCEDYLFALRSAEIFPFRVVPRHLVGYRDLRDSMSTNVSQMYRSFMVIRKEYRSKYPQTDHLWSPHLTQYLNWLVERSLARNRLDLALRMYVRLFRQDRTLALTNVPDLARTWLLARMPQAIKRVLRRATARNRPLYQDEVW